MHLEVTLSNDFGSEWQGVGMRASEQTQQFHDAAMKAGAEHLRVGYDAVVRHRRRHRAVMAAGGVIMLVVLVVLLAF